MAAAGSSLTIPEQELKLFHSIDREIYSLLVMSLWRDPAESMQVLALWLWLERIGFRNVAKKILSLPLILINDLAEEMVTRLYCILCDHFTFENVDIPLLQCLIDRDIPLKFFHNNRVSAAQGVANIINEVCIKACQDIMIKAIENHALSSISVPQLFTKPKNYNDQTYKQYSLFPPPQETNNIGVPPEDRTLFVTFSRGYPVHEWELREFLTRVFGDCVESLYMQQVEPRKQALFARIVFHSPKAAQLILNGKEKAKFNIKGKHVWARKFVAKLPKPVYSSLVFLPPNLIHASNIH